MFKSDVDRVAAGLSRKSEERSTKTDDEKVASGQRWSRRKSIVSRLSVLFYSCVVDSRHDRWPKLWRENTISVGAKVLNVNRCVFDFAVT